MRGGLILHESGCVTAHQGQSGDRRTATFRRILPVRHNPGRTAVILRTGVTRDFPGERFLPGTCSQKQPCQLGGGSGLPAPPVLSCGTSRGIRHDAPGRLFPVPESRMPRGFTSWKRGFQAIDRNLRRHNVDGRRYLAGVQVYRFSSMVAMMRRWCGRTILSVWIMII